VNRFRPAARTVSPDGRRWEIYAYKLELPPRRTPDPAPVGVFPGYRAEAASELLDGILYLVAFIPRLLVRLCVDLPVAAVRAARSDQWTIEAVSWAPYPTGHKWSTTREYRGQVLAQVEGGLARGETPHPRNARVLQADL
jgi:hypothetical protein